MIKLIRESILKGPSEDQIRNNLIKKANIEKNEELISNALKYGFKDLISKLLEKGAPLEGDIVLDTILNGDCDLLDIFYKYDPESLSEDEYIFEETPLTYAIESRNFEMVKYLIDKNTKESIKENINNLIGLTDELIYMSDDTESLDKIHDYLYKTKRKLSDEE